MECRGPFHGPRGTFLTFGPQGGHQYAIPLLSLEEFNGDQQGDMNCAAHEERVSYRKPSMLSTLAKLDYRIKAKLPRQVLSQSHMPSSLGTPLSLGKVITVIISRKLPPRSVKAAILFSGHPIRPIPVLRGTWEFQTLYLPPHRANATLGL